MQKTTINFVLDCLAKFLYKMREKNARFWTNVLLLESLTIDNVDVGILRLHEANLGLPDKVFPIFDNLFTRLQVVKLKKLLTNQQTIPASQTTIQKVAKTLLGIDNIKVVRLPDITTGFDYGFDVPFFDIDSAAATITLEVYLPQEFNTQTSFLDYDLDIIIEDGVNVSLLIFDKYLRYIMPYWATVIINYKFFD